MADDANAPSMTAQTLDEHRWLQRLVGDWTYEAEGDMGPDQPPVKSAGEETVRPIGELWVLCEGRGHMPDGTPATTLMTLGFDPERGRYVGTWIGSMMTKLWIYDGEADATGRILTLTSRGPDMTGKGGEIDYRDVIEWIDDDRRILRSMAQDEGGDWKAFMTAQYRRKG